MNTQMKLTDPWLLRFGGASAPLRLICFAYAGGHGGIFSPWRFELASVAETIGFQLPGRGTRFAEPLLHSFDAVIDAAVQAIVADDDRPCALFGHSLGGWLAFETTRRLVCEGHTPPVHLFVSGCQSPRGAEPVAALHLLPQEELIERLRDFNGTPPQALEHAGLMGMMLPVLRADFALVHDYRYRPGPPLNVPLTILGGRADGTTAPDAVGRWAQETTAATRVVWTEGDHFFINSHRDVVLREIQRDLDRHAVLT